MTEASYNGSELARGERLQLMLSAEELAVIDDFRFSRRMPSRASAIRELLRRGLSATGFNLADAGMASADFGVIEIAAGDMQAESNGG